MHKRILHKDAQIYDWTYKYWRKRFDDRTALSRHFQSTHCDTFTQHNPNVKIEEMSLNDQVTKIWNGINKKRIFFEDYFDAENIYSDLYSTKLACKHPREIKEEWSVSSNDESKNINQYTDGLDYIHWKNAHNKIHEVSVKAENTLDSADFSDNSYHLSSNHSGGLSHFSSSKSINSSWYLPEQTSKWNQKSNFSDLSQNSICDIKSEFVESKKSAFTKIVRKDASRLSKPRSAFTDPVTMDNSDTDYRSNHVASASQPDLVDVTEDSNDEESENIICINLKDLSDYEDQADSKAEPDWPPNFESRKQLYAPVAIRAKGKWNQLVQTEPADIKSTAGQSEWVEESLIPEDTMGMIRGMFVEFMKVYLQIQDPRIQDIINPCIY